MKKKLFLILLTIASFFSFNSNYLNAYSPGYSYKRGPPLTENQNRIAKYSLLIIVISSFSFLLIADNYSFIVLYRLKSRTKERLVENNLENLDSVINYANQFLPELLKCWSTKDYNSMLEKIDSNFLEKQYYKLNSMFNQDTWNYLEITKIEKTVLIGLDQSANLIAIYIKGEIIDEVIFKTNFKNKNKSIPFKYILEFEIVDNKLVLYNHILNSNASFLSYIYKKFYLKD